MVHRLPTLTGLVLSICVAQGALPGCAPRVAAGARAATVLPRVPLVTAEGRPTELGGFLRGRAALVSFWATWCDACVEEMPALNRLATRVGSGKEAVVVGIAIGEPRDEAAAFARAHQLGYPLLVDEDFHFADALGERRVPTTLVIDRTGRIVYRGGALDEASLAAFHGVAAF